jgi:hypothetical protein
MIRRLSLAICSILFLASPSIGREWTDRSGTRRVEATLVEVVDGSVRLKKPDGKIITLPLDQLSPADRDFVAAEPSTSAEDEAHKDSSAQEKDIATSGPLAKVTTFAGLEALAKKQTNAATVVTLYKLFLRASGMTRQRHDLTLRTGERKRARM